MSGYVIGFLVSILEMNHGRDKGMFSGQFTVPGKWQVRQEIKKELEGTRYCRLARENRRIQRGSMNYCNLGITLNIIGKTLN